MRKPPLLYGPDGNSTLVAADSDEEKLRALCLLAFGALKGLARAQGGSRLIEDADELVRYQSFVASKIADVVTAEAIEAYYGVRLTRGE